MNANIKIGDHIKMDIRNSSPNGGTSAYAGFEGTVSSVLEDGSFCIDSGKSVLIVPLVVGGRKRSVWIWLNDELIQYPENRHLSPSRVIAATAGLLIFFLMAFLLIAKLMDI